MPIPHDTETSRSISSVNASSVSSGRRLVEAVQATATTGLPINDRRRRADRRIQRVPIQDDTGLMLTVLLGAFVGLPVIVSIVVAALHVAIGRH